MFLSYGAGWIVFPILGGLLGDLGNFPLAFTICGVACLVGAGAGWVLRAPHHDEAEKPFSMKGFLDQLHLADER